MGQREPERPGAQTNEPVARPDHDVATVFGEAELAHVVGHGDGIADRVAARDVDELQRRLAGRDDPGPAAARDAPRVGWHVDTQRQQRRRHTVVRARLVEELAVRVAQDPAVAARRNGRHRDVPVFARQHAAGRGRVHGHGLAFQQQEALAVVAEARIEHVAAGAPDEVEEHARAHVSHAEQPGRLDAEREAPVRGHAHEARRGRVRDGHHAGVECIELGRAGVEPEHREHVAPVRKRERAAVIGQPGALHVARARRQRLEPRSPQCRDAAFGCGDDGEVVAHAQHGRLARAEQRQRTIATLDEVVHAEAVARRADEAQARLRVLGEAPVCAAAPALGRRVAFEPPGQHAAARQLREHMGRRRREAELAHGRVDLQRGDR